jgi:hypothetical protein
MADARALYDGVANDLAAGHGVAQGKAFGMPGLKLGSKIFAGLFGDDMVFKLGAGSPAHTGALKLEGATLWDPSGMNRPFKEWVQVPLAHAKRWPELAQAALESLTA